MLVFHNLHHIKGRAIEEYGAEPGLRPQFVCLIGECGQQSHQMGTSRVAHKDKLAGITAPARRFVLRRDQGTCHIQRLLQRGCFGQQSIIGRDQNKTL